MAGKVVLYWRADQGVNFGVDPTIAAGISGVTSQFTQARCETREAVAFVRVDWEFDLVFGYRYVGGSDRRIQRYMNLD